MRGVAIVSLRGERTSFSRRASVEPLTRRWSYLVCLKRGAMMPCATMRADGFAAFIGFIAGELRYFISTMRASRL